MKIIFILLTLILITNSNVYASEDLNNENKGINAWLTIGPFGTSFGDEMDGGGAYSAIAIENRNSVFIYRSFSYSDSSFFSAFECIFSLFTNCGNYYQLNEQALLYGFPSKNNSIKREHDTRKTNQYLNFRFEIFSCKFLLYEIVCITKNKPISRIGSLCAKMKSNV